MFLTAKMDTGAYIVVRVTGKLVGVLLFVPCRSGEAASEVLLLQWSSQQQLQNNTTVGALP